MRSVTSKLIRPISLAISVVLAGTSVSSLAQELSISGGTVSITQQSGGFTASPAIGTTGTVGDVASVPVTAGINVPIFSFTLVGGSTVPNGSYNFNAGVVIKDVNSSRRLEIKVPQLTLTFSGGVMSGTVASGNSTVLGRDASGTVTIAGTVNDDGSAAIVNNSVRFNAASVLTKINANGSPLNDIINTVNAGGSYTYTIVLKQTSGSAIRLGTSSGGTLTQFPKLDIAACDSGFALSSGSTRAASAEFVIPTSSIAGNFTNGYAIQGRFSVGGSPLAGTLGSVGISCAPVVSNGGTPTTPSPEAAATASAAAATTSLLNTIESEGFSDNVSTQLSAVIASSGAVAKSVAAGLQNGTVSVATAVSLFNSIGTQMDTLSKLYDKIDPNDPKGAEKKQTLRTSFQPVVAVMRDLLAGFKGRTLTASENADISASMSTFTDYISSYIRSLFREIGGLTQASGLTSYSAITLDTLVADISAIIDDYESGLNDLLSAPGFIIDSALFINVRNFSQASAEGLLAPLGTELGLNVSYSSDAAAQNLLSANAVLLDRLVDGTAISMGGGATVDSTATQAALTAVGLSTINAANLTSNLATYVNPVNLTLNNVIVSNTLASALGGNNLTVDPVTNRVNYTKGTSVFAVFVKSVSPAPTLLPDGQFSLADGSSLIIGNGLAIILVTAPDDIVEFAQAIQSISAGGFTTSVAPNGRVSLTETASGVVFSSQFTNAALVGGTAAASTTFNAPSGDPASIANRFTVTFVDGIRQEIIPMVADNAFFRSVESYGFQVSTNKNTGVIQIGNFLFRPDFFQTPLTTTDTTYLNNFGDSSGVAYRAVDANGDGKTDYQVITSAGVQTVYGLQ